MIGLGNAIIVIRGVDLASKEIARVASRFSNDIKRIEKDNTALNRSSDNLARGMAKIDSQIAQSATQLTQRIAKINQDTSNLAARTQVSLSKLTQTQDRDINKLIQLYNKVPAAQQGALLQVETIARRITDRQTRITQATSQQQRAALMGAQQRDAAQIYALTGSVQGLTRAEQEQYAELARKIALRRSEISLTDRGFQQRVTANQAEIQSLQGATTALQQKLTTERDAAQQQIASNTAVVNGRMRELETLQRTEKQLARLITAQTLFSNASAIGLSTSAMITFPGLAVGGGIAKVAVDYDKALRNIQSIGQQTDLELQKLSDRFIKLSTDITKTTASPAKLAEAFYEIQSAAFYGAEAEEILRVATKAATAGLSDQAETSKAIATALRAYNVGAVEAAHFTDVMIRAVDIGIFKFEDLTQQMGDFIGAAGMMKVPIEEVMAAMTTMTKRGIQASEAATSINRILMTYLKPSKQQKEAAQALGIELSSSTLKAKGLAGAMEEVARATKLDEDVLVSIFGEMRAARGIMALMSDGLQIFNNDLGILADSMGSLDRIFGTQTRSWSAFFDNLRNSVHALAIAWGKELLPMLAGLLNGIKPTIQWLTNLDSASKRVALAFGGIAIAVGPVLLALGFAGNLIVTVTASLIKFNATLAATRFINLAGLAAAFGPIGIAVAGAIAIIAGLAILLTRALDKTHDLRAATEAYEVAQANLNSRLNAQATAFDMVRAAANNYNTALATGTAEQLKQAESAKEAATAIAFLAEGRAKDARVQAIQAQMRVYEEQLAVMRNTKTPLDEYNAVRLKLRELQLQLAEPWESPFAELQKQLADTSTGIEGVGTSATGTQGAIQDLTSDLENLINSLAKLSGQKIEGLPFSGVPNVPEVDFTQGALGIDIEKMRGFVVEMLQTLGQHDYSPAISTLWQELEKVEAVQAQILTRARELAATDPSAGYKLLASALGAKDVEDFLDKLEALPKASRDAVTGILQLNNIPLLQQASASLDDFITKLDKIRGADLALPGTDQGSIFDIDARAYMDFLNQLQSTPGIGTLYQKQIKIAWDALGDLVKQQVAVGSEAANLSATVGNTAAWQYLAEAVLGSGASIQDLIDNIDQLGPAAIGAMGKIGGLTAAVEALQDIANDPIRLDVYMGLVKDSLQDVRGQALELARVWPTQKITDWYNSTSQAATRLAQDLKGTGSSELEIAIALEQLKNKNSDFVDSLVNANKEGAKSAKDAANEAKRAWEDMVSDVQSKLDEGINFSVGLKDMTGGGPLAPGNNGAFEALYRIQDVAANLGKPTEGKDTKKWYEMYFGGMGFEEAIAKATDIIKKFQMGMFTPDVTQYIDEGALVNAIQMEKLAEESKKAYAEALAKAHPELDRKIINSYLGLGTSANGATIVPDMTPAVQAIQTGVNTSTHALANLDYVRNILMLDRPAELATVAASVIPILANGIQAALIEDELLYNAGTSAGTRFGNGFRQGVKESVGFRGVIEDVVYAVLSEED